MSRQPLACPTRGIRLFGTRCEVRKESGAQERGGQDDDSYERHDLGGPRGRASGNLGLRHGGEANMKPRLVVLVSALLMAASTACVAAQSLSEVFKRVDPAVVVV